MSWIFTCEAREHDLVGFAATHPDNLPGIREIAHSLAQINRFTGHASRPYSVAEHSLLVAALVQAGGHCADAVLAALMHDAHECITGDTNSQVKLAVGTAWDDFEHTHQRHLLEQYELHNVYLQHRPVIKHADLTALATERRDLMPFDPAVHRPWAVIDTPGHEVPPADIDLNSHHRRTNTWETWASLFEAKASQLLEARMAAMQGATA